MILRISMIVALLAVSLTVKANVNSCSEPMGWAARLECSNAALTQDEKKLDIEYRKFIDECKSSPENTTYTDHGNGPISNASIIIDRFKTEQDAWLIWRDAKCNFEAVIYLNGSMEWDERRNCISEMTKSRILEIKKNNFCRKE